MKKIGLIALLSVAISFVGIAQNGGGCTKAITITTGTYRIDSFIKGTATYARLFPFPTAAKWYKYTPANDGLLTISTCGGLSDSRVFMYTGTCDSLKLAGYNDDFCESYPGSGDGGAANLVKLVKAAKPYYIEFDNAWDTARFPFTLTLTTYAPGATQDCSTASAILPGLIKVDSLFGYASHGDASRANWYKYTPTRNGKISLSSCGSDADTRVYVYKGACTALTTLAESDDDCLSGVDSVASVIKNLAVVASTTYYFEWDDIGQNYPFSFVFTFDATSSIADDALGQSIAMYPNPTSDVVNLDFDLPTASDLTVQIFNAVGQSVLNKKFEKILRGGETLDVSDLKSGVYIVQVSDGARRTNKKLVVSR